MLDFNHVHPKDIHAGDRLWDSGQYGSVGFEVIDDPTHINGKWIWKGKTAKRGIIEFLITDGYEHYGPRIYRQPMYATPEPEPLTPTKENDRV